MEKSFKILVKEHYEMLFWYALSLCNDRSAAEDVVQESFLTAYRRLDDFDPSRDFGAWIRGITRNLTMAENRKSARVRIMDLDILQNTIEDNFARHDSASSTPWKDRLEALKRCLEKADAGLRRIIQLYYAENIRADEIASSIGISVDTVWQRLSRGRKSLKLCIDKQMLN